jgi:hypothetical protein
MAALNVITVVVHDEKDDFGTTPYVSQLPRDIDPADFPMEISRMMTSDLSRSHSRTASVLATAAGLVIGTLPFFHSRRIFPMRVIRRMVPSKRIATAIWKLGLLTTVSFLPIRFNVREY